MGIEVVRRGVGRKVASVILVLVLAVVAGLACGTKESADGAKQTDTSRPTPPSEYSAKVKSLLTLASLYQDTGEYEQALPLLQEALELQEEFLGPGHEGTATSHNDLGMLHQRMGNHAQALDHLRRALEIRESVLGTNRRETAASFANLADVYQITGDNEKALPNAESALAIRETILGPDHPDTVESIGTLADLYYILGDFSQALPLFQRTLAIQERQLGPGHPDSAITLAKQADSYFQLGRLDESLVAYLLLLGIQDAGLGAGHPDIATSVDILADLYFNTGQYQEALPYFQRALAFREKELGAGHLDTAKWRGNLAQLHERLGNYSEAVTYYELAVVSTEKALDPQHVDVAALLNDLADLHLRQEAFDQALPQFQSALTILSDARGPEDLDTVISLRGLGESYRGLGDFDRALPFLNNALMIREKALGPDHPDTATSLGELAELYRSMGDYTRSLPLSKRALEIWNGQKRDRPGVGNSLATALNNLGVLYQALGDYGQAQQLLQSALEIRDEPRAIKETGAAISLATSLNNLAVLYKHTGDYAKSLPLLQRALEIIEDERGADHPDTATSLNNLADFYFSIYDLDRALGLYQRALDIMEDVWGIGHRNTAPFLNNLADLYFVIENYDEAAPLFQRALEAQVGGVERDHPETATYLSNLAVLHRSNGNNAEALKLYNTALDIRIKTLGPDHVATATSLNNLATLYSSMGEYIQARPLFEEALAIRERTLGADHPDTAISLNNLGIWHESVGNYDQALEFFRRALSIEDRVFTNMFAVASEEQKLVFTQANQGSYHATLSLINRHFPDDQPALRIGLELVLARKGMVLNAQSRAQAVIASNLQGESSGSWQRLTLLRGNLANLLLRGPGDQDATDYGRMITDLNVAIGDEEVFLAQNSSQMAQQFTQRQVTAQMLANRLPQDGLLVEYVRIRDWSEDTSDWTDDFRYLAFSLTPDNRIAMVDLGNAVQIDSKIIDAIIIVENPDYGMDLKAYARETDRVLSELYTLLLGPLEADLKSRRRLFVSPDGEINKVPFVALRTSDGPYLVETHTVSYVASGRDLLRDPQKRTSGLDLLLVADAAFDDRDVFQSSEGQERGLRGAAELTPTIFGGDFPPLPGTAREAEIIPPLVQGTKLVLLGEDATEASVLAVKSPRVLHLATHGFFIEDSVLPLPNLVTASSLIGDGKERGLGGVENLRPPSTGNRPSGVALSPMVRSGLAFAGANHSASATTGDDGILTALEVTGMDLRGTELVVLSACETAVGEVSVGEGIFGLRRAFVLAGAENLVMSLWLVNDALTVTQMERFYEAFGDGETIPDALRQAQLESIATLRGLTQEGLGEPFAPVRLWAPFMVQQTGV